MASKSETVDIESLQKSGARRGRCLFGCLVFSVIVLFMCFASLAGIGFLLLQDLQSQLRSLQQKQPVVSNLTGGLPEHITFKMQNFAYLEAASSELDNVTMKLSEVSFLDRKSVGSIYDFNRVQHCLRVKQAGVYFLYMNLNLTCGGRCHQGHFSISVLDDLSSDRLRCDVKLPNCSSEQPQQRKCWAVTTLRENTTLHLKMSLPHGPLPDWRLQLEQEESRGGGSGFGIFLMGQ